MNDLENDLLQIYIDIMKNDYYMVDFFINLKEKVEKSPEKGWTVKARETAAKIFTVYVQGIKEEYNRLYEGKVMSFDNKRLGKLESHFQEILANIDTLNEKFPQIVDADFVSKNKGGIKFAREAIEKVLKGFANIYDEFNAFEKENFSWREVQKLYDKAEKKCAAAQSTRWAEAAQNRKLCFQGEITFMAIEFVEEINKGNDKIPPDAYPSTVEELNFLQKLADEFPRILDFAEKTMDEEDKKGDKETKIQELKAKNEELKSFIQQQRKKLGSSSSPNQPKKPNPQDQQKLQTQQNEIDYLKQQLFELRKQIEEMKKNKANLIDQAAGQEVIEKLEEKKQEIQTQLEKKQFQQKELKNKVNSQINSSSSDKFNWLYVVIPGAILLVMAGIVIAYLLGKKNKKE